MSYYDWQLEYERYLSRDPDEDSTEDPEEPDVTTANKNGKPKTDEKDEIDIDRYEVEVKGDRFIFPEGLTFEQMEEVIQRKKEQAESTIQICETIACFPLDGAVALSKVLKARYGWVDAQKTPGFWADHPPSLVGVDISYKERIQVPWGSFAVPKIDGRIQTSYTMVDGMPHFLLTGEIKRKDEHLIADIVKDIKALIRKESIYKTKAISISFRDNEGNREDFNTEFSPKFLDLDELCRQEAIYSAHIEQAIEVNLFNPVLYSDRCRKQSVPLKRGVLLAGPFGTGKTLTAYKLARLCVENGWTFVYLKDVRDLDLAVGFAKLYEPCVLFAEDIDRATAGPRSPELDRLLNNMDGLETKDRELMIVLTTNNLQLINPAALRPGRIDTIIEVLPPDIDAICRMVRKYGVDSAGTPIVEGTDEEIKEAVKVLEGANAAFIRECVERSKLAAIAHSPDQLRIVPSDLKIAAGSALPHVKLINPEHGTKSLLELEEEMQDPLTFAMQVLVQKLSEGFIDQITNPKVLKGIIKKQVGKRRKPFGGDPMAN